MAAVTGSEVERYAGVAACEALGLADVQLVKTAAADHSKHGVTVSAYGPDLEGFSRTPSTRAGR
jgi:hypothetical protein